MKRTITITPNGNIQVEIENQAIGQHYISGVDNKHGIEVLTNVKDNNSITIFLN